VHAQCAAGWFAAAASEPTSSALSMHRATRRSTRWSFHTGITQASALKRFPIRPPTAEEVRAVPESDQAESGRTFSPRKMCCLLKPEAGESIGHGAIFQSACAGALVWADFFRWESQRVCRLRQTLRKNRRKRIFTWAGGGSTDGFPRTTSCAAGARLIRRPPEPLWAACGKGFHRPASRVCCHGLTAGSAPLYSRPGSPRKASKDGCRTLTQQAASKAQSPLAAGQHGAGQTTGFRSVHRRCAASPDVDPGSG